jgi:hypothetical protein
MKKIVFYIFILGISKLDAQIHEVGVFLGGSNYIGDVGRTDFVSPNQPAYGVMYRWNKSPRHSWRISYVQSKITGNDLDSNVPGRYNRGYNFENNISEISAGLEFNFFDFNLHEFGFKLTPYVYSGLSYTNYEELYFANGVAKKDTDSHAYALPMIIGIKTNITPNLLCPIYAGRLSNFGSNFYNKMKEESQDRRMKEYSQLTKELEVINLTTKIIIIEYIYRWQTSEKTGWRC